MLTFVLCFAFIVLDVCNDVCIMFALLFVFIQVSLLHAVGPLLACALLFCRCVLMFNIVGFATFGNYVMMLNDVFLGICKLCVLAHIGT